MDQNIKEGLSSSAAKSKLSEFGLNRLPSKSQSASLKILASQFKNFLTLILIAAAVFSLLIGDAIDSALIFVILLLNTGLGFWQEYKASKELEALRKLEVSVSRVIRDGVQLEIPSFEIVPGDIVVLESGDKVPADGILIESYDVSVDEAALTGESQPVFKSENINNNQIYFGTKVVGGRGKMEVLKTGSKTKFGNIALTLSSVQEEPTPLEISLNSLAKKVALLAIIIALAVLVLRIFQGEHFYEALFSSTALMIAAVPEGLPAVVTVLLAVGVSRMYKKKTLVRRMSAIESLGATTLIASDKTGTLTKNEMTVQEVILAKTNTRLAYKTAVLCNSASLVLKEDSSFDVLGDSTEGSLLIWAKKNGIDIDGLRTAGKIEEELPFSLERKMMSVLFKENNSFTLYSKGAPESILPLCNLSEKERMEITKNYQKMASKGFRVLALAQKDCDGHIPKNKLEEDLEFLGLVGIADAARPEAKEAIARAYKAGIQVVMVTGDSELTAKAIAQEIGLLKPGDEVITGAQLKELSDAELSSRISKFKVFARVVPEDKLRIVKAYQSIGHVVAVTGDGVNDSLALKQAQVGVSMGKTGTDVAKEASDIIILDDNLSTILSAVEEGRTIYNNILKTFKFLMTGNLSEALVIVVAAVAGLPTPLLPVQILWINFVTDGLPALSLAFDKPSYMVMFSPPRDKNKQILDGPTTRSILLSGSVIAAIVFAAFLIPFNFISLEYARSSTFTVMVIAQMVFIFLMRKHHSPWSNKVLLGSVGLVLLMQFLIITVPGLRTIFKL